MLARFSVALAAMVAVVAASNFLVQFPVDIDIGAIHLGDILTWGAFTYPVAFLITDLTNRSFGPTRARMVVMAGFAVAVLISIYLATPRIAIASGAAFLTAQLLDVSIFNRLRTAVWWKAPVVSSLIGSAIDTAIFFSLAFAAPFTVLDTLFGREDGSLAFPAPLLGVGPEVELWTSLALGDFIVKLVLAALLLVPYKRIRDWLAGQEPVAA